MALIWIQTATAANDIPFGNHNAHVIGNNEYDHLPDLETAINNARGIAAELEVTFGSRKRLLDKSEFQNTAVKLLEADNASQKQWQTVLTMPPSFSKHSADRPKVGLYAEGRKAGSKFSDCTVCPEMIAVPAGHYRMGDMHGNGYGNELPVHTVVIPRPFAVGVYEVTFAEWDACVNDDGCNGYQPNDDGRGRGNRPVTFVNWDDAQAFVDWLNTKTSGRLYRLLSEAEWEYVARAGTSTKYWWGGDKGTNRANCDSCGSSWDNIQAAPVGSFPANKFGLYDVHGNVWEWVEDCWTDHYRNAPTDGSARLSGDCALRVLRGGSWNVIPWYMRAASRGRINHDIRINSSGFRVAKTLLP